MYIILDLSTNESLNEKKSDHSCLVNSSASTELTNSGNQIIEEVAEGIQTHLL